MGVSSEVGRPTRTVIIMPPKPRKIAMLRLAREQKLARNRASKLTAVHPQTLLKQAVDHFIATRKREHLLLLDVDGTIVNFKRRLSERIVPRPHLQQFLRMVSAEFDIVLFSRGSASHVEFVKGAYCSRHVKVGLGQAHWPENFKVPDRFIEAWPSTVIVDDNPDSISLPKSIKVLKIKKWRSENRADTELLRTAKALLQLARQRTIKSI